MAMNDAVDWARDLGGGVRVALVQAGTFRSDAGTLFGPVPWVLWGGLVADEVDDGAAAAPGAELPAGRDARRPGARRDRDRRAGGREDAGDARATTGRGSSPRSRRPGSSPATVDIVAMSHLHFDHAGGLLRADGSRAFPRARIVAQKAEWEVALGDNPRLVASYVQPELRLVARLGRGGLGRRRARDPARRLRGPDRRSLGRPPGGHRPRRRVGGGRSRSSATCSCGHGPRTRAG